jgi:hypothetical protein
MCLPLKSNVPRFYSPKLSPSSYERYNLATKEYIVSIKNHIIFSCNGLVSCKSLVSLDGCSCLKNQLAVVSQVVSNFRDMQHISRA